MIFCCMQLIFLQEQKNTSSSRADVVIDGNSMQWSSSSFRPESSRSIETPTKENGVVQLGKQPLPANGAVHKTHTIFI